MCLKDCVCVKDGVWQNCACDKRWCVTKMCVTKLCVWQKMVCDKDVCGRWCVTKMCVKDGVWQNMVCDTDVCNKVVWQRCVCVLKMVHDNDVGVWQWCVLKMVCDKDVCVCACVCARHACHAKRRSMSPKCHACHANGGGDHGAKRKPSASPEPAQCQ